MCYLSKYWHDRQVDNGQVQVGATMACVQEAKRVHPGASRASVRRLIRALLKRQGVRA